MEALQAVPEEAAPQAAARTSARSMFRYSEYLDLGDGAAECEHSRDGACDDIEHFHAWCRLPNPYQHEDIRRKALAAKARKIRELRDPESDASVVLDQQLADGAEMVDALVDEIVARDWAEDYIEAQTDVDEREEFEHIVQDREEFQRLSGEEEPSAELKALEAHLDRYATAVKTRMEQIQDPKRAELRSREPHALIALVRNKRVEEDADAAFMETYRSWMWFVGTFRTAPHPTLGRPHLPMWEDIGARDRGLIGTMFGEAPEVIEALQRTFTDLQLAMQRGSAGN